MQEMKETLETPRKLLGLVGDASIAPIMEAKERKVH